MSDHLVAGHPAMSLRGEHSEATRQALIACGREAFGTTGYHDAGIESVARAARVSRGALYHHFRDKKALFEAVVIQAQAEGASEIAARASGARDPWDQLVHGVDAYLDLCQRPDFRRIVIEDGPAVLGKVRCSEIDSDHVIGVLKTKLGELQAAHRLSDVSAAILGDLLAAMICEGAQLIAARPADRKTPGKVRAVLKMVLETFRTPAPRSSKY